MFKKDRTVTYTFEEFFNNDMRKEVEKLHRKKVINKYLSKVGTTTAVVGMGIATIGGAKYMVAYIPIKATVNTLVACTSTEVVTKASGLNAFNELVAHALNKLYAATCVGGMAVESIQCGGSINQKKFGACLTKYCICYTGGLFVLYALAEMKNLA